MAKPYIDTPRTEVDGNATFMTNGPRSVARHHLSALDSVENSFQSPSIDRNLVRGSDTGRKHKQSNSNLRTPKAGPTPRPSRNALHDRRNLPNAAPPRGEFTPLLNSVARNNFLRNKDGGAGRGPQTPATIRGNYGSNGNTPGLPNTDLTELQEDETFGTDSQATPLPPVASSSPHSTPLAMLPGRDGSNGLVGDGRKMMTLREQENVSIYL